MRTKVYHFPENVGFRFFRSHCHISAVFELWSTNVWGLAAPIPGARGGLVRISHFLARVKIWVHRTP